MGLILDGTSGISATGNITGGNVVVTNNFITNNITTPGNITSGNMLTSGVVSATGNITGGNISVTNVTGTLLTAAQNNVTSVGTLSSLAVTANVQGGNIRTAGQVSATGNVTGGNVLTAGQISATGNVTSGNVVTTGNVTANVFNGNVQATTVTVTNGVTASFFLGTVLTPAQTSITSVGTLSSLAVTASITGGNLVTGGFTSSTGNITGGNIRTAGLVSATGTITSSANIAGSNLTTPGQVTSTGNVTGGNIRTAGLVSATGTITGSQFNGSGAGLTNIPAGNVTGALAVNTTGYAATVSSNAQPNITSVGTLSSLNVTANVQGGNIRTAGLISATGTATASQFNGSGAGLTNIPGANVTGTLSVNTTGYAATVSTAAQPNITSVGTLSSVTVTANVQGGNIRTAGLVSATGTVTGSQFIGSGAGLTSIPAANVTGTLSVNTTGYAARVSTNAQPNITSTGTLTSLTVSGVIAPNTNGTINLGAVGTPFATVYGTVFSGISTQAKYADLAENYLADAEYAPGTVVAFGGEKEVTISRSDLDVTVAGVVSTNPAYHMNSELTGEFVTAVALTGRVPCRVTGTVTKGAMMVSNGDGTARAEANPKLGSVIGKALQSFNGELGTIEIVVGRL